MPRELRPFVWLSFGASLALLSAVAGCTAVWGC